MAAVRPSTATFARGSRRLRFLLLTLLCVLAPAAGAQAEPLRVVVSIPPYADLVARVAGERATVSTLLPPGASPHAFDPSPSQAAALANADLVVMNGGLDGWLTRLVSATAPDAALLVIMDVIRFEPLEGHEHAADDAHGDEGVAAAEEAVSEWANPHVWLDPTLAAQAASAVAESLAGLEPGSAPGFRANAGRLREELAALDEELRGVLAGVQGAPFVPFHDAWVYFAARYGLDIVVTLEPFPGRQPSPRYLADAVRSVRDSGARAIFAERQLGARSAEVVAESAGVAVAILDPLGGVPGPTSYEELLLHNARIIAEALAE